MEYKQAHKYGTLLLERIRCMEIIFGIEALRAEIRGGDFEMSADEMERRFNEIVSRADEHMMDVVSDPQFDEATREFMRTGK